MNHDDVRSAIDFLTQVMGMQVVKSWGPEEKPLFAYLAWKDTLVSVWVRPEQENAWSTVGPVSMDLHGADEPTVRATHDRAVAAGADVVRPLAFGRNPSAPQGYLGFSVRDAEGNLWSMSTHELRFEIELL